MALAQRSEQQHVVLRIARLPGLQAAGDRMLPVDVDAVELRIGLQEIGAGLRECLRGRLGCGHLVERSRIGPATDRHDELQVRMLLFQQRDLIEQSVRAVRFAAVAGIYAIEAALAFHVSRLSGSILPNA